MPMISVIIPTYQHADTIAACLDSVFLQTFKDIEVVVVNDGSTDNTDEVLKPYLDKIIYKKIENSGAPKARNVGFGMSHGKFVIFADADLIMSPEMLQTLQEALNRNPDAAYAYCGFRFGMGRFKGLTWSASRLKKLNYIHTSALIRREAFIGFDESIKKFQDWDMWLSMLEKGMKGVAVNKLLFSAKPRKAGMSWWVPKMFYSDFFKILGIKFKSVVRYDEAAAIIAKKHNLNLVKNPFMENWLWTIFLGVFVVSGIAFAYPSVGTVATLLVLVLTVFASLNRLIYGVGVVAAELIIGSLAGKTLALTFLGFSLPLRMGLFAVVGAVWLIRLLQGRARWPNKNIFSGVVLMLVVVGWGILNGILHGIGFKAVFSDANAYFSLPLILIFLSAMENENDQKRLTHVIKHGVIALSVLTIAALYFFSHKFLNATGVFAYKWLRDSRIAEITALQNGTYRIFIQSQIFCLLAFIMLAFRDKAETFKRWAWGILPATALIISQSRSFILGLVCAGLIWFVLCVINAQPSFAGLLRIKNWMPAFSVAIKKFTLFVVIGLIIFFVALKFPFPDGRNQRSFQDMLISKNSSQRDAAVTSRWSLLKELNKKIITAPIFGSGFGTTITYQSSDPRILSTTGGSYTTAAFEWNYHDILVKMGIFGLLAYGYLLFSILTILWKTDNKERVWLIPSFLAIIFLNTISPFLNHPLGIGYLAILVALADRKRGEVVPVAATEVLKTSTPNLAAVPGLAMISEEN